MTERDDAMLRHPAGKHICKSPELRAEITRRVDARLAEITYPPKCTCLPADDDTIEVARKLIRAIEADIAMQINTREWHDIFHGPACECMFKIQNTTPMYDPECPAHGQGAS